MASLWWNGAEDMLLSILEDNYKAKTLKREALKNDCELSPKDVL